MTSPNTSPSQKNVRSPKSIATVLTALVVIGVSASVFLYVRGRAAGTTFYSQGSLPPEALASWNTARNGSGTPPLNFTSGDIFVIQNTHNMGTAIAWTVSGAGAMVEIESGGTLTANNIVAVPNFQIDNGGTYVHNAASAASNGAASDIPGSTSRTFGASSTVEFQKWANGGASPTALPNVAWGNLKINVVTLAGSWQQSGALQTVNGNLIIQQTGGTTREFRLNANTPATSTLNLAGDLQISGGIFNVTSGAAVETFNIGGNFSQSGGTFTATGAGPHTVNFTGGSSLVGFTQSAGTLTDTNINWSIASGKTVQFNNAFTLAASRTFTINSGGMLLAAATITNNGTVTVNGEFRLTDGGFAAGNNFTYGANGILGFTTAGGYNVGETHAYWPTTNGPQNVTVLSGGITMGVTTPRTVGGLFQYASGVSSANNLILNGTSQVNTGGFTSGAPTYGSSSLLKYNTGGNYGRNGEWLPNVTSGAGYPANVQLSNNTNLDLPNGSSNASFQTSGNLTIDSGSTLNLNGSPAMTQPLNVLGNVTNNGTLTLSTSSGGDLKVQGDFANNGTFTPNNRAVFFEGGNTQSVSASGGSVTIPYVVINKSGGTVTLSGTDLTTLGPAGGASINFVGSSSTLTLNGRTVTLGSSIGGTPAGSGFIGDASARMSLQDGGAAGSMGTLTFVSGGQSLQNLTVNRTGVAGTVILGSNLTVGGTLTLTAGQVLTGANALTVGGAGSVSRTNGYINGTEQKNFTAGGSFTFDVGTANGYSPVDAGSTTGAGSLSVKPTQTKQPNVSGTNALSRYWTLSGTGVTTNLTFHYLAGDVVGTESNYKIFKFNGTFTQFTPDALDTTNHFATLNGVSSFSDWTLGEPSSLSSPLSGTKTVCASGCDYVNLTGASGVFADVNANGLSGDLVVSVAGNLTEDGTNALNQWTESPAGSNFTVTIQPDSATVRTISGSVAGGMIRLNGADRVTFDGRSGGAGRFLLFRNTGTGSTFTLAGDASNDTIRSSVIEGRETSNSQGVVFFSTGATAGNDNDTVTDNQIRDRSDATGVPVNLIFSGGTSASIANSNNTVSNNELFNFTNRGVNVSGINPGTSESWTITGNDVHQTAPRAGSIFGISVGAAGSNTITGNTVHDMTTGGFIARGINFVPTGSGTSVVSQNRVYSISSTSDNSDTEGIGVFANDTSTVTVVNNMVSIIPSGSNDQGIEGLLDQGAAGTHVNFFYNSVIVGGTASGANNLTYACLKDSGSAHTSRDNIFFNGRTGGGANNFAAGYTNGGGTFSSDYNIFAGTGANAPDFFDTGTDAAPSPVPFAQWQTTTGGDAHSQAANPGGDFTVANIFASATDLHLNTAGNNPAVNSATPLASVITDFDGDTRDAVIPDAGADEVANAVTLQFAQGTYTVGEGGGSVTLNVTRAGGSVGAVSVHYSTADVSATAGSDYTATSGTLTWNDGDLSAKSIEVPILQDGVFEGDETFTVGLDTPTGGAALGTPSSATVTITDDEAAPSFSVDDVSHAEGDSGTTDFTFTVTKTGATALDASVDVATSDGTATAGSDYAAVTTTTLTFGPAETTKTVTVQVNGDTTYEADETFSVNLTNASGATVADNQGLGTITNDDAPPATLVVNTTDDDDFGACLASHCSLREAINAANFSSDSSTINFAIPNTDAGCDPSGVCTIAPSFDLPAVTAGPTTIDGDTQTGASANTATTGSNAVLKVVLSGANDAGGTGLELTNSTVRGLVINGFSDFGGRGVALNAGNTFAGNFVGTDAAGAAADGNDLGVHILADNNTVGGTAAADRNVVSGNGLGLFSDGTDGISSGVVVEGNLIGTTSAGDTALGNGIGIDVCNGSTNVEVGGGTSAAANVISGNSVYNVLIDSFVTHDNKVQGNLIGPKADGTGALAPGTATGPSANALRALNAGVSKRLSARAAATFSRMLAARASSPNGPPPPAYGVFIDSSNGNTIGGTNAGEGNTIAFNGGKGVAFNVPTQVAILGNSIHDNGDLGIDGGDDGVTPNDSPDSDGLTNFPVIDSALVTGSTLTVSGSLHAEASTEYRLEFFTNASCDASGNGEGATFVGTTDVTTDGGGDATFTFHPSSLSTGQSVTATATNTSSNATSEFSACATAQAGSAGTIQFSQSNYTVAENGGVAHITISRVGGSDGSVSATFSTSDGTATTADNDYVAVAGQTVTFADGDAADKTVDVTVNDDSTCEADETVNLSLSITTVNRPSLQTNNRPSFQTNTAVGSSATLTITNDDAPPSLSVDDVSHAEGDSGTTDFTFTVTKTGATALDASVDVATSDGTATAGSDYAAVTTTTLTFGPAETTKTVTVQVNGDTTPELDETFNVNLSNPSGATVSDGTGVGTIRNDDESVSAGQFIISEFRLRGPGASSPPVAPAHTSGAKPLPAASRVPLSAPADTSPQANDEFVELYNATDSPLLVTTTDGSKGWALSASDGVVRFIIPNGTTIPARGHFLGTNTLGYSLSANAAGDPLLLSDGSPASGYTLDIPDNAGIAVFRTSTPANFTPANRLDAAGSTSEANTLYKEGAGYPALSPSDIAQNLDYSFYRSLCSFVGGVGCTTPGVPKDTGDNSADFLFVDTNGTPTAAGQRLGAPGPENLSGPVQRNTSLGFTTLDRSKPIAGTPNRARPTLTGNPSTLDTFGTLSIRRRVTNTTASNVTRLRFRIVEVTTFPAPAGTADLRALSSSQITVSNVGDSDTCGGPAPCTATVKGTTLEEPPTQLSGSGGTHNGGGFNSSLAAGTITLAQPLQPGQSVNLQFLLGVMQTGSFRFLINIEAVTGP